MSKYIKHFENEDGWSDWIEPADLKDYKLGCCDCGLIHHFQFEVVEVTERKPNGDIKNYRTVEETDDGQLSVILRARRNNRSTGQLRRRKRKNKEKLNFE